MRWYSSAENQGCQCDYLTGHSILFVCICCLLVALVFIYFLRSGFFLIYFLKKQICCTRMIWIHYCRIIWFQELKTFHSFTTATNCFVMCLNSCMSHSNVIFGWSSNPSSSPNWSIVSLWMTASPIYSHLSIKCHSWLLEIYLIPQIISRPSQNMS